MNYVELELITIDSKGYQVRLKWNQLKSSKQWDKTDSNWNKLIWIDRI